MLEKIKQLCKQQNKPVCKMEQDLGLGKNTITQWDKSVPSVNKVAAVANYLGVTVDELLKE